MAGPAGRRSGEPAARQHAADRPDGTRLVLLLGLGVALDRYWLARSREQEAFGLLAPVLRRPEARNGGSGMTATAVNPRAVIDRTRPGGQRQILVLAFASDTGRACPAAAPHAVAKRRRAPADP
jgi:hypothetical protein